VLDHRIEVYNGRAGAGIKVSGHIEKRALSSTTRDLAFLHVRATRRMDLKDGKGRRFAHALGKMDGGDHQILDCLA
jgi:hypothetical protein